MNHRGTCDSCFRPDVLLHPTGRTETVVVHLCRICQGSPGRTADAIRRKLFPDRDRQQLGMILAGVACGFIFGALLVLALVRHVQ